MNSQPKIINAGVSAFSDFINSKSGQRLIKVELARFK